ncbi:hypothetical protein [Nesterenkonia alba]|nr:hypothetical protein [Nesterenkonia alba]
MGTALKKILATALKARVLAKFGMPKVLALIAAYKALRMVLRWAGSRRG